MPGLDPGEGLKDCEAGRGGCDPPDQCPCPLLGAPRSEGAGPPWLTILFIWASKSTLTKSVAALLTP
jgi:hypothetical protein